MPAAVVTVAQGANRGYGAGLWWGGRKEMKSFGPPLCLNRALKEPKGHQVDFAIIAKFSQKSGSPANKKKLFN